MRARSRQLPVLLSATLLSTSLFGPACVAPEPESAPELASVAQSVARSGPARAVLDARARWTAGAPTAPIAKPAAAVTPLEGADLIKALDIPAGLNPTFVSGVSPDPDAAQVIGKGQQRETYGTIRPTRGDSFLLLSTGVSAKDTPVAEPGTDFEPSGAENDVVTLRFQVNVPPGRNRLSFDYTFLSAESPDFVGSRFNDTFTATVSDALGANRVIATASVNSAAFHPASATTVGITPFLLFADNAAGVNNVFNQPGFLDSDAGTTGFQKADAAVAPGVVTIEFDIRDLGDGSFDSAVIIDNLQFSAIDVVDPRTDLVDTFTGQVLRVPDARLATGGTPVRSVAADGVTQVVLRSNVPGPGTATFSTTPGGADGSLSNDEGAPVWAEIARASAVLIGGKWYVFALYRSPPDFNRGGDEQADIRTATVTMTYVPADGARFSQDLAIGIVRPPVVVVPDLWSGCLSWLDHGSLLANDAEVKHRFAVSCVDYRPTMAKSFDNDDNRRVLRDAIDEALIELRGIAVAATRVDVIGQGMGGLLARRYVDEFSFVRFDNFLAGEVNRLILMNTPNLGSRLADEIVRFRRFAKARNIDQWNTQTKLSLLGDGTHPVAIDDVDGDIAVDDMRSASAVIDGIGKNASPPRSVHYHALATSGGRGLTRNQSIALMSQEAKMLYQIMENQHPFTIDLGNVRDKQKLILGSESVIFCKAPDAQPEDDHDLFATVWEQRGGLSAPFVSLFALDPAPAKNGHFRAQNDPRYQARLVELLDAPVGGGLFATSMPRPDEVQRVNHCAVPDPPPPAAARAFAAVQGSIAITAPAPGTLVTPGSQVTVTVAPTGPAQPEAVLISGLGDAVALEAPPFTARLTVPAEFAGTVSLTAIALYPQGGMALAQPVPLRVQIAATVTAIEVLNGDTVLQRAGRTRQLTVIGTYSDGVRREITAADVGTRYGISQLVPVAEIGPDGLITAVGPGDATLAISNGPVVTSINVKVGKPACGDGVLDPGEQCDDGNVLAGDHCDPRCQVENAAPLAVCTSPTTCSDPGACAATVTDLAAGSSDPDSDPLRITQSPPGPYAVGSHAVAVNVSDGQLDAQCTSQLEVLDCEAPSVSCPPAITAECTAEGSAAVAPPPATATDNCAVAAVDAPAAGVFPLGTSQIAYTATDPSGNAARCTTDVTVQDTTPPAITCPSPVIAECTGARQAVVEPAAGSASDTCTTATVSHPGAAAYPLGTTPVTYTASDRSGNQRTCETTVTVADTTAPDVACPAPVVAECTGDGRAIVDPGAASASDRCTTATVTHPGAAAYALGTTSVEYTALDEAGNQARCATSVTVRDTTAPTLACPAPTIAECTGGGRAVVDPGAAITADACTRSVVSHPGVGSYPLGTTPVTYSAHDGAGNQASCTTAVTVRDTTPPAITCPPPIVAECTGSSRAFVRPAPAASSDVCTGVTVRGPRPGLFPLGTTEVRYTSNDATGHQASCRSTIDVVDTRPPEVRVARSLALSPADHRYRTVHLADCGISVDDACGGELAPSVYQAAITCVTADEPDNARGGGDGDTREDIVLVDATTVRLRAERDAGRDGRVYQIHFRVRDASGNREDGVCKVVVPRDPDCRRWPHDGGRGCGVPEGDVANSVCAR